MVYVLNTIVGSCCDKVAAVEFNPEFKLSPMLTTTELTYLCKMVHHHPAVESYHWHGNKETLKFEKEYERAFVVAEGMQKVSRYAVLLNDSQHDILYKDVNSFLKSSEESVDDDSSFSSSCSQKKGKS